jgi:hypothetical protein
MSNHHVPFTSNLQMWSPSSSITLDCSNNTITKAAEPRPYYYTSSVTEESRYYYHEPIMYPAYCMLCGLPHHYHHTVTKPSTTIAACKTSAALITPAPLENRLPVLSLERPQPKISRKHFLKLQRPIGKHQKSRRLVSIMRKVCCKVLRICSLVVNAPLTRRHNIYPVRKHQYEAEKDGKGFH